MTMRTRYNHGRGYYVTRERGPLGWEWVVRRAGVRPGSRGEVVGTFEDRYRARKAAAALDARDAE